MIMRYDAMASREQYVSTRAVRFPIQIPVRYRTPQSPEWLEARTENVSYSGVLFRTDNFFEPATILELRLELPPINGDGTRGEVVCKGEVVRAEQRSNGTISTALAVAIHRYRLIRKSQPN